MEGRVSNIPHGWDGGNKNELLRNSCQTSRASARDFRRPQLEGYGLDDGQHPIRGSLQTYIWQEYDLCPEFPELYIISNFWPESSRDRCTR